MAPTLYGMHFWTTCPNCSTQFNVGASPNSSTGEANVPFSTVTIYEGSCGNPACGMRIHHRDPRGRPLAVNGQIECQACGRRFYGEEGKYRTRAVVYPFQARCPTCQFLYRTVVEKSAIRGGNKILVNKYAYSLGRPERWDVIVFEFDQWKNYIKRLIGLPGEHIQLFDGDVYVDGKIVCKRRTRPAVQDDMWNLVSDSDVEESGLQRVPAWKEVHRRGSGAWTPQQNRTRWSINNPQDDVPAAIEYQRGFDNFIHYNLLRNGGEGDPQFPSDRGDLPVQVGDRKLSLRVTPTGGTGWIGAEIRDGAFTFRLRIPVGRPSAERPAVLERVEDLPVGGAVESVLSRDPHPSALRAEDPLRATRTVALPFAETSRVEIENVDDLVVASIDGAELLWLRYVSCPDLEDPPCPAGEIEQSLWILGAGVQATVESIRVYQDFYYSDRLESTVRPWEGRGIQLGEGQYLALGDNSPASSDGRRWGFVPESNLMGKALLVFWPAWPFKPYFQCKFIR
ncbi:MAG: signal peptidase I [Planctomycetes bacterium]|nr:signal peptidase I [Planctomycetota bacterium]